MTTEIYPIPVELYKKLTEGEEREVTSITDDFMWLRNHRMGPTSTNSVKTKNQDDRGFAYYAVNLNNNVYPIGIVINSTSVSTGPGWNNRIEIDHYAMMIHNKSIPDSISDLKNAIRTGIYDLGKWELVKVSETPSTFWHNTSHVLYHLFENDAYEIKNFPAYSDGDYELRNEDFKKYAESTVKFTMINGKILFEEHKEIPLVLDKIIHKNNFIINILSQNPNVIMP